MKIEMIRHGKVDMTWKRSYDSVSYDAACAAYDVSPIRPLPEDKRGITSSAQTIYIGTLSRTKETALQIFGDHPFKKTSLIIEVPKRSWKDTKRHYPLLLWRIMARTQWFFNNPRQPETRKQTLQRAKTLIDMIESRGEDVCMICHGFFMIVLERELRRRGYRIRGKHKLAIRNWEKITAEK